QAVTGELVAAVNYADPSPICGDPQEGEEGLEHAGIERGHAAAFAAAGRGLGLVVQENVDGKHWELIRDPFPRCIAERDTIACLIIQEIMLESFAVASYARVARVAPGNLARTFGAIAAEEEEHVDHAMAILKAERALDPVVFDEKLHALHLDVMS